MSCRKTLVFHHHAVIMLYVRTEYVPVYASIEVMLIRVADQNVY